MQTNKNAAKPTVIPINLSNPIKKEVSPEKIIPNMIKIYITIPIDMANNSKIQNAEPVLYVAKNF